MTVICTKPTTPESRKRHAEIFGDKLDRYCKTCGRLPSFCECDNTIRCFGPSDGSKLCDHELHVDGAQEFHDKQAKAAGWGTTIDGKLWQCPEHKEAEIGK